MFIMKIIIYLNKDIIYSVVYNVLFVVEGMKMGILNLFSFEIIKRIILETNLVKVFYVVVDGRYWAFILLPS